jgi:hypothetical protein
VPATVTAVTAHRELGFVEVQAGRRRTADTWLAKAQGMAETDQELAAILGVRGMNSSDVGDYPGAFQHLEESVERAGRCADHRQQAGLADIARPTCCGRAEPGGRRWRARSSWYVSSDGWRFGPAAGAKAELDLLTGVEGAADELEQVGLWPASSAIPAEGMAARGWAAPGGGDHPASGARGGLPVQPGTRLLPMGARVCAGRAITAALD